MAVGIRAARAGVGRRSPRRRFLRAGLAVGALGAASGTATPVMSQVPADSLAIELVVPARVRAGTPVPITLRVRNRTERTLDLYLRGRAATFDVAIENSEGGSVWRRLEGEVIPAIVHLRALSPGAQFELRTEWNQRGKDGAAVAPGAYRVRGLLLAEGAALESGPASLRIDPP